MLDNTENKYNLASSWNGSIAIKITAVTIWFILILAFAITMPFISTFEESTIKEYSWQQHQIEELIKLSHENNDTLALRKQKINTFISDSDIKFVDIKATTKHLTFGNKITEGYSLKSKAIINNVEHDIYVEFPSLKRSILLQRVKIGSAIVGFSVLFSIFLFLLNKNIIHEPFNAIITLTQRISQGENHLRLNSNRGDEFGLVSKFLNEMLDIIDSNQQDLRKANAELKEEIKHRDEALAASQQKSAFLANMSHEIRTPLSSIIGYTERIRFDKSKNRDDEKRMLDIVLQNGNHLLHLVNDILDLSKVEANKLEIEKKSFSIIDVTEHARRLLNERASEKNIQLDINYILPLPKTIINDDIRTKQIILNLASNAIRFTDKGSVSIDISYREIDDMLIIDVKDTGIGMSAGELENLFKPFSQADASISRRFGGTGLGLTISKRLAELMDGDITAQSIKGVGSRFTCVIKAGSKNNNDFITELTPNDLDASSYKKPIEGITLSGKILLVEDTYEIQQLVKAYIEDYGIQIDTADNGKDGINLALNNDYDLVLMDIQMPIMNGKEAITELRKNSYMKPVIALTADALTEHKEEFFELGFTETLTKPIIINDLIASLQKHLSSSDRNNAPTAQSTSTQQAGSSYNNNLQQVLKDEENQDDILYDLKIKYLNQLPSYVNDLKQSIAKNDLQHAHAILHQLKGISGSLGIPELTNIAAKTSELLYCGEYETVADNIKLIEEYYVD